MELEQMAMAATITAIILVMAGAMLVTISGHLDDDDHVFKVGITGIIACTAGIITGITAAWLAAAAGMY